MKKVKKIILGMIIIVIIITNISTVFADDGLIVESTDKYGNKYTITAQEVYEALKQWSKDQSNYDALTDKQLYMLCLYKPNKMTVNYTYENDFRGKIQDLVSKDAMSSSDTNILFNLLNYQPGVIENMATTAAAEYEKRKTLEEEKEKPENEGKTDEEIMQDKKEETAQKRQTIVNEYNTDPYFKHKTVEEREALMELGIEYQKEYQMNNNGQKDQEMEIILHSLQQSITEDGGDGMIEEAINGSSPVEEMETIEIPEYTVSGIVIRPGNTEIDGEDVTNPADNPDAYKPGEMGDNETLVRLGGIIVGALKIIGIITGVVTLVILGIKYIAGSSEEKAEYKKTMIPYVIGALFLGVGGVFIELIFNLIAGIQF